MRLIDQPLPGLEHVTEARQIERDFAGAWHVWISSAGRWWLPAGAAMLGGDITRRR